MTEITTPALDAMVTKATQLPQQAPYRVQRAVPLVLLLALIIGYLTILPQSQTLAALDGPMEDITDIVTVEVLEQA